MELGIIRHSSKRAKPGKGAVRIGTDSSIRKLMRAARRGTYAPRQPDRKALERHPWFRRQEARA